MSFTYYTEESMKDKKLSDLKDNDEFLVDSIRFLRSSRKGYSDEQLKDMSSEDIVYDVLEHFRVLNTNEVTMAKDYYFAHDDQTPEQELQSYARLMNAFDNAKGEGMFDGGGAAIRDYAEGVLTAPSTAASIGAGLFSFGSGAAAVQGTKQASLMALKNIAKKSIGRAAMAGVADAAVAGGSTLGTEKIKKEASKAINEDYDISFGNVAASAALGAVPGAVGVFSAARYQNKAAQRLVDVLDDGRKAKAEEIAKATKNADELLDKVVKGTEPSDKKLFEFTTRKLYKAIDPKLVEEGKAIKYGWGKDLPDGVVGGLDSSTVRRLSAASYQLAKRLGVKPEKGQSITEVLAKNMTADDIATKALFDEVADQFGLTRRQLSAAYAAEVSEAARTLAAQSNIVSNKGVKLDRRTLKQWGEDVDKLAKEGMSTITSREVEELKPEEMAANLGPAGRFVRGLKEIEDARRAFMTSQPATTMRNNIFGVAMGGIDVVDQIFTNMASNIRGREYRPVTQGALDNLKYLSKDAYVAEAVTKMLSQDAPEPMSRLFMDAARAEASLVSNSKLAKAGQMVNTLNTMSDSVFKKAVLTANLDRKLKELNDPELGLNIMDVLRKGNISGIPTDMLDSSIDEAFAYTFQRRFGGKDASVESRAVNKAIRFIHNSGLTTVVPFPRYIASQAKFVSDYTGITIARRVATGKGLSGVTDKEFGKTATGALGMGLMWSVQGDNIKEQREWYQTDGIDGKVYNAQAAMGPAAPMSWLVNNMRRSLEGEPVKDWAGLAKEGQALFLGTEFRPGTGAGTSVIEWLETGSSEPIVEELGNYFKSFTYPAAVVKDFYGQFDPRASYIPETMDPTGTTPIELPILPDLGNSFLRRIASSLPDFNLVEMKKTANEILGTNFSERQIEGFFQGLGANARTNFQTQYDPTKGDTGYDMIRFDVFGKGPARLENPFMKQITGLVGEPPKTALQKEMTRLQLDPFKVYNPYGKNYTVEALAMAQAQGLLAARMEDFMQTPRYTDAGTPAKRTLLKKKVNQIMNTSREIAKEKLKRAGERGDSDYDAFIRNERKQMSKREVEEAEYIWETKYSPLYYEGKTLEEVIDDIDADKNLDSFDKQTMKTDLLLKFTLMPKLYSDAADDIVESN